MMHTLVHLMSRHIHDPWKRRVNTYRLLVYLFWMPGINHKFNILFIILGPLCVRILVFRVQLIKVLKVDDIKIKGKLIEYRDDEILLFYIFYIHV